MDNYDDDPAKAAFERALDLQVFLDFAEIVQNFDDTAFPEHDDIDFEFDSDGYEYDNDGEPVMLYGVVIYNFKFTDDYDPLDDDYEDEPSPSYYRFPSYKHYQKPCDRRRDVYLGGVGDDLPPV